MLLFLFIVHRSWLSRKLHDPSPGQRSFFLVRGVSSEEEQMFGVGMPELLVILVIILVIFGAGKLPQIGEGLGKGIRNFRKATTKDQEEIDVTAKKSEEISEKK